MDRLKQIEAFVSVATRGSLSAAARLEGVTPAIIGRRIDALEARLGARLLVRTTRKLTLTFEGRANPEVRVTLNLSDRLVDLINENIDCAVRIGDMTDSSLVSVRLGEMRRMVVASPAYLVAHGVPRTPADLDRHECLSLGQQRGWG